jgi:hypothetical protein
MRCPIWVPGGPDFLLRPTPLSGELIRYQSDYDDYVCLHDEVSMLDGDGTDSSTQVPVAKRVWVHVGTCGYVLSCLLLNDLATRGSRLWGHFTQ